MSALIDAVTLALKRPSQYVHSREHCWQDHHGSRRGRPGRPRRPRGSGLASIGQTAHDAAKGVGNIAATLNPSADSTAASTAEPTPEPTPTDPLQAAAWEIGCDDFAAVGGYAGAARPSARPDRGPITHASGPVIFNADGEVETYTVQPGDAGTSIGERFCVDYVTLLVANDVWPTLQPGDVLVINP